VESYCQLGIGRYVYQEREEVFKESINLCHYYSTGTLDQKVRELLLEGDLLNRNVFELMQPKLYEELISIDEWLKIFVCQ